HLDTNDLYGSYVAASAQVFRADSYIASYGTTTSDHYPVITRYNQGGGAASVTVTSPNGGESWAGGSSHAITWTSANVANVKIDYSLDGGTTWTAITSSTPASSGSYTWTVPNTASTSAKVRVTDTGSSASDASNAAFTITTASLAKVIINEILANEPGSDTNGEFVEIVNVGGTAASIGGWTISDATSVRHTFAAGTSLAAGKAIVVFAGSSAIPAGLSNAVASSTGLLSLANGGDSVILKNGTTTIDSFAYTSSLAGTDGVSMNRSPDTSAAGSFVLHTTLSTLSSSAGKRVDGTAF
ncbi:MAG TPA: lamin tail domain-containing protein, partial [Longimicrobiaceae bacterium]